MRRALTVALAALLLAACTPPSGRGLPSDALDDAIGNEIGDPSTCVLLADRATGAVVYRYGDSMECERALPRCDGPGTLSAKAVLRLLPTLPQGRMVSCASVPDASRIVGWAAGKAANTHRDLVYSAVMEGDRALPGREIEARLAGAFRKAGL